MNVRATRAYAVAAAVIALAACVGTAHGAEPAPSRDDLVQRGRYVVKIAGCNDCHTPGYVESAGDVPESSWLTGSPLGYRGAWGTTYASSLRQYVRSMTAERWIQYARTVKTRPPMPWFSLRDMNEDDLRAMHAFMASLGPASGFERTYLPPGVEPKPPFVTFPMPPASR